MGMQTACLSRLPLHTNSTEPTKPSINMLQIGAMPVTVERLKHATNSDPVLSRVLSYTMTGWPKQVDQELHAYYARQNEITVEDGCLLWGMRVIVPHKLRCLVLKELHHTHPGIVRMKSLARIHVCWPRMDRDIESEVKSCGPCQTVRNRPSRAPLHPWAWPEDPWQRIHVDFAGPFMGHMFLIVVDSYSKWLEVIIMQSTIAAKTIEELRNIFARNGIPHQLVSDNGPQFVSDEFRNFMKVNGIRHIRTAVYHPASNGEAECFVQTLKNALKRGKTDPGNLKQKLAQFLLRYRTTPSTVTARTPAELFLKRQLRTRLDLLNPCLRTKVAAKQAYGKNIRDRSAKQRQFKVGEEAFVQNFRGEPKWLAGTVVEKTGPVSYRVQVGELLWKRRVDQIRGGHLPVSRGVGLGECVLNNTHAGAVTWGIESGDETNPFVGIERNNVADEGIEQQTEGRNGDVAEQRYPTRSRKAPARYGHDKKEEV